MTSTFGSLAQASDAMIAEAVRWYGRPPAVFRFAHPRVLATARRLCDGDWHRCVLNDDRSITVHSRDVW